MHRKTIGRLANHPILEEDLFHSMPMIETLGGLRTLIVELENEDDSEFPIGTAQIIDVQIQNLVRMLDHIVARGQGRTPVDAVPSIEKGISELRAAIVRGRSEAIQAKAAREVKTATGKSQAAEQKVEDITAQAAKAAVKKHAARFEEFRKESAKVARDLMDGILMVSALGIMMLVLQTYCLADPQKEPSSWVILLHESLPRAVVASFFFVVIGFLARNYSAARHNEMVNGRRAAALESFDDFYIAMIEKSELQAVILKQVTTAIFAEQDSGYIVNKAAKETEGTAEVEKRLKALLSKEKGEGPEDRLRADMLEMFIKVRDDIARLPGPR